MPIWFTQNRVLLTPQRRHSLPLDLSYRRKRTYDHHHHMYFLFCYFFLLWNPHNLCGKLEVEAGNGTIAAYEALKPILRIIPFPVF